VSPLGEACLAPYNTARNKMVPVNDYGNGKGLLFGGVETIIVRALALSSLDLS